MPGKCTLLHRRDGCACTCRIATARYGTAVRPTLGRKARAAAAQGEEIDPSCVRTSLWQWLSSVMVATPVVSLTRLSNMPTGFAHSADNDRSSRPNRIKLHVMFLVRFRQPLVFTKTKHRPGLTDRIPIVAHTTRTALASVLLSHHYRLLYMGLSLMSLSRSTGLLLWHRTVRGRKTSLWQWIDCDVATSCGKASARTHALASVTDTSVIRCRTYNCVVKVANGVP